MIFLNKTFWDLTAISTLNQINQKDFPEANKRNEPDSFVLKVTEVPKFG